MSKIKQIFFAFVLSASLVAIGGQSFAQSCRIQSSPYACEIAQEEEPEPDPDEGGFPTEGNQPFVPTPRDPSEDLFTDSVEVDIESNPIYTRLLDIVNFLSIGVGIVATISVVVAGIQYTASRGDPGKTQAAVNRLIQVGVAIFLYIFGFMILNWLIPGGVL